MYKGRILFDPRKNNMKQKHWNNIQQQKSTTEVHSSIQKQTETRSRDTVQAVAKVERKNMVINNRQKKQEQQETETERETLKQTETETNNRSTLTHSETDRNTVEGHCTGNNKKQKQKQKR